MNFTREEWAALSREIDAASSLMRHGFAILGGYRFASRDDEPLFACRAGGTEKLLKLTFGLVTVDEGDPWPTKATMRDAGHKIVELDRTVRSLLIRRQQTSTAPGLIARLLEMTDGHPGVGLTLATLERYAVNGRFYNLDLLGGRAQGEASPAALWDELEMDVIEANPDMIEESAYGDHDQVRQDMNRIIARSFGLWCELVLRSWMTGVCGDRAQEWSGQLDLGHVRPRLS
jgi:hypothetical protein